MKITDVQPLILRQPDIDDSRADGGQDTLVVKVVTDEGIIGIGEVDSSPEIAAAAITAPKSNAVVQGLRGLLIGQDPLDIQSLWERMYRGSIYAGRRGAVLHALSGIDIALWDIAGQAAASPVCHLLTNTPRESIRLYASILMDDTTDQVTQRVSALRAQGFTAAKLGWGPLGKSREHDVELANAAREAAGPDMDLMLDAGYGYGNSVDDAVYVANHLADLGFRWLEEPFLPDELDAYSALTAQSPIPIAAGEQCTTVWDFRELIEKRAVNIIQPDLARCGGISEMLRIAKLADDTDTWCVPHAWKTGILKAASLHVNAVLQGERLQEWCVEDNRLAQQLVSPPLSILNGYASVPSGPGLGISLNEDLVAELRVT
jgi:L-rhamnonate dehydratase